MYRLVTKNEFGCRTSQLGNSLENHFECMRVYNPYIEICNHRKLWGKEIYSIADNGDRYEVTLKDGVLLFNAYFDKELFREFVVCEPKYEKDDFVVLKDTKEVHKVCRVIGSAFGGQTFMCHTYKYALDNGDVVDEYKISAKIEQQHRYNVDGHIFEIEIKNLQKQYFEEEEKNKKKENEKMTYFDYLKQTGGFERLIKSVHFNEKKKTTTVVLINGDIGLSTCMDSDEYDKGVGFAVALQNALFGSKTKAKKFIDSVIERQDKIDNAKKKAKDNKGKNK